MNYKELLNRCKEKPGWLGTREQKDAGSQTKYRAWVAKQDDINDKEKEKDTNY